MRFAAICLVLASVFLALAVGVRTIGQGTPRGVEPRDHASATEVFTRANEAYDLAGRVQVSTGAARSAYQNRLGEALERLRKALTSAADPEIATAVDSLAGLSQENHELWRALRTIRDAAAVSALRQSVSAAKDADRVSTVAWGADLMFATASLALLVCGLFALLRLARHTARERQALEAVLPAGAEPEALATRAARLVGKAERLAEQHDRAVIGRISLTEAVASYEDAQRELFRAQDTLMSSLDDARGEVERMRVSSMLDEMTGALKYPYMVHRIRELLGDLLQQGRAFCLLELDLDNFKDINDTFGHAAGDDALRDFSRLLRGSCRETDLVIRKSGDEFFVLAPATSLDEALALGERLRAAVNAHTVVSVNAAGDRFEFPLGASIGVLDASSADLDVLRRIQEPDLAVREIISYVDAALYRAKHAGKNCVRGYETGMRVVDLSSDETPPDLPRINRLARSRYARLGEEAKTRFDALLTEASELLFPRRRVAGSPDADDESDDGVTAVRDRPEGSD